MEGEKQTPSTTLPLSRTREGLQPARALPQRRPYQAATTSARNHCLVELNAVIRAETMVAQQALGRLAEAHAEVNQLMMEADL